MTPIEALNIVYTLAQNCPATAAQHKQGLEAAQFLGNFIESGNKVPEVQEVT